MEAAQSVQPQRGLTFDDVWAALMEDREHLRRFEEQMRKDREALCQAQEEALRQALKEREEARQLALKEQEEARQLALKEQEEALQWRKELNESIRRSHEELERTVNQSIADNNKMLSKLGFRFGELAEHLVAPNLAEKFNALGYNFRMFGDRHKFWDTEHQVTAEVDVLLHNKEYIMAVEIKAKPTVEDINEQIERLKTIRRCYDAQGDKRALLGAVAGAIMPENVKRYILKRGLYVVEQNGDTVRIDVPEGFKPREW